jgi:modulator of FtsH protease
MPGHWVTFFATEVGAAAALSGLVFVALSINLRAILEEPVLVGRAAEALILLLGPVAFGLILLSPYGHVLLGGIELVLAAAFGALLTLIAVRAWPVAKTRPHHEYAIRIALAESCAAAEIAGAAILLAAPGIGAGWIGFGGLLCIAAGIADAWVLLVEILR